MCGSTVNLHDKHVIILRENLRFIFLAREETHDLSIWSVC